MILPDPNQSTDIPVEVPSETPHIPHPYFRQLTAIISVFVLTAGLGLAVKLAQNRQNPFSKAGGAIVTNILTSQHRIGEKIGLSVQPVDSFGSPILYDMDIQWGMSSTNSVGDLKIHSSKRYAEFVPNGNDGIADIWVRIPDGNGSIIEKGVLAYVKGSYPPETPQPTPTPTPSATPLGASPTPTPTTSPVNHTPVIITEYLPSVYRGEDYMTTITAYDQDNDEMKMTAITLPEGIKLGLCEKVPYYLNCTLAGNTLSTSADAWSVRIEVTESRNTTTTKYLTLYVSPAPLPWVSWYNDSIKIYGNIGITVDGKKYKNMGLGANTLTDNSIDLYWYEHGFNNAINIKFNHDNQNWWISELNTNIGGKVNNSSGATYYVTPLGRPFYIQDWQLPYAIFKYFSVQAFANIEYQPEFLTEELPAGRLFGWYTAAISIEDRNLNDWNSMEFENLPIGLTLGTCATQNRQYPATDNDNNILHCLITGRPVSIGDHKLKAKIYDNNHDFVTEREFILPVRLFSSDPPSLPELIVTKTDYPSIFMPGKKATIIVEVTNIGGSATVVPSNQTACTVLNPGESCNLAFDVTYTNPGPYEFTLENLVTLPITVAPPGLVPMTVTTIIPGQHNQGDIVMGHVKLNEYDTEAQFVYQASKNNFVAILTVPADLAGKNLNLVVKTPGRLAQKLAFPLILDPEGETPIDATSLPSPISDFNNDNKFDISDVGLALSKYTSLSSPVGSDNKIYDINGDGVINIQDIALMLSNYTKLTTNGD